jgi:hypothetical protein
MKIRLGCDVRDVDSFINTVQKKYHFTENDFGELSDIYQQIQLVITPYAEYRINRHTTGVELIDRGTATAVAMSLGAGLDRLQERYMREEKLSEAYMLDCISSELLLIMYKEFNLSYARFHRRYVERYVFIGDLLPVTAMRDVLEFISTGNVGSGTSDEIKQQSDVKTDEKTDMKTTAKTDMKTDAKTNAKTDMKTDAKTTAKLDIKTDAKSDTKTNTDAENKLAYRDNITANEYGVLTPSKSVVFYAILSENPAVKCRGICLGCGNTECENRYQEEKQLPESQNQKKKETGNKVVELNYGYQRIFGCKN